MRIAQEVGQMLREENGKQILANIRTLRERFEQEALLREKASKTRRAKAVLIGRRARGAHEPSWLPPPL
jgi:hypothetical protein